MALLEKWRVAPIAAFGALLLMGVACGDEQNSADDGDDDSELTPPPAGKTDRDAGKTMDGGNLPVLDGQVPVLPPPPAVHDSGAAPNLPPSQPGTDAMVAVPLSPLPHDGLERSVCTSDNDCSGGGLKCFAPPLAAGPGVCVQDCDGDADCPALDGVEGTCSTLLTNGACEYACGGSKNDGMGQCPKNMACTNFGTPNLLPIWRCSYPDGPDTKSAPLWGKCDRLKGAGDCADPNTCFHPAASLESLALPSGYCINDCSEDADCAAPAGKTAVPACIAGFGKCVLRCEDSSSTCPDGMACVAIDPLQTAPLTICVYTD